MVLTMWRFIKPSRRTLRAWQLVVLVLIFGLWHLLTVPGLLPHFLFSDDNQAAFFFGEPLKIFDRILHWFFIDGDIYRHLGVTLLETVLAFGIGTVLGLGTGLWLALSPLAAAVFDPYIKAMNAMPRVILAPIFAVWFGLGVASKVALGVTLVFFVVFFNVYQGVKEVSPVILANARMPAQAAGSCCATSTCPAPRAGSSARCTPRWAWRSSARWWESTSARPRASAT
jgi:NitT/TauT family transport system permease protein